MTISDSAASCIDGFTFNLPFSFSSVSMNVPIIGSKTVTYYFGNLSSLTAVPACSGSGSSYLAPPYDCSGTPNSCSTDVSVSMLLAIKFVYDYFGNRENCEIQQASFLVWTGGKDVANNCTMINTPGFYDLVPSVCNYPFMATFNPSTGYGDYSCSQNFMAPIQTLSFSGFGTLTLTVTE